MLRLNILKYNCVSKDGQDSLFDLFTSLSFARTRFISNQKEIETIAFFLRGFFFFFFFFREDLCYLSDFQKIRFCAAWTINNFKLKKKSEDRCDRGLDRVIQNVRTPCAVVGLKMYKEMGVAFKELEVF